MRSTIACFVLAAAIATPGIVVAAKRSSPTPDTATLTSSARNVREGTPIDPRWRPTVRAVKRALARTGVHLHVVPFGAHDAAGMEFGTHGRCSVIVLFGQRMEPGPVGLPNPCPPGEIDTALGPISFTPASLRATIEPALR